MRADLLDKLREQPDPVAISALVAVTGRHPNTLREQLTWLVEAGLVVRVRALSEGRGRPAWLYQAVGPRPAAQDHAEIAAALAWSLGGSTEGTVAHAEAVGRRRGAELCRERASGPQASAHAAREQVRQVLSGLGFAPEVDAELTRLRLTRCPLLQAAHANEPVVCGMHEGLVAGILDESGFPDETVQLVPFAEPGACLLLLSA